jgi:TRAP-type C4-dicarboxylate transport system permease large subunit
MTVELGLIHPPVGMNVFVIKSVVQEVTFSTISAAFCRSSSPTSFGW